MVRLKDQLIISGEIKDIESQSHYGSIKSSLTEKYIMPSECRSQSHYVSIKREAVTEGICESMAVSIPLWFD